MARAQREKGKRGEREARDVLRAHGFAADRDGRLDDDLRHDVDGYHFEVKRRETLALPAWMRQAIDDAGNFRKPVVLYRRSREPWYAVLEFEVLARLLAIEKAAVTVTAIDRATADAQFENAVDALTLATLR